MTPATSQRLRLLASVLTVLLVVALLAAGGFYLALRASLPPLEGESVYQCWWVDPQTGEMVAGSTFKVDENGAGVWVWSMPRSETTATPLAKQLCCWPLLPHSA